MKIGIMQPYFFPYIGYFQLINHCDHFIFLDNVQYINRGWINRNRIILNDNVKYITVPVCKSPQNTLISNKKIHHSYHPNHILNQAQHAYKDSKEFNNIFDLLGRTLKTQDQNISSLASNSIINTVKHLKMDTQFHIASQLSPKKPSSLAEDYLIELVQSLNGTDYINMSGGRHLYSEENFLQKQIKLHFLKPYVTPYPQRKKTFTPELSILDLLMNCTLMQAIEHCNLTH